jgi:glycosyltransferase involved in cell wall biosynthesis
VSELRVILLTTAVVPRVGGPFESVAGLARGLASVGATDVTVVACTSVAEGWRDHQARFGDAKLSVHSGPMHARLLSAHRYLAGRLAKRSVDVVHASGLWDGSTLLADSVTTTAGIPLVWSIRGMLEPWAVEHHRYRKRFAWLTLQRAAVCRADAIHSTSVAEAASCRRSGLRQPIAVIPNGIDLGPAPAENLPTAVLPVRRVVYLGRLHPKKGLANLIEAWRHCRTSGWELEIAGPDEDGHAAVLCAMVERHSLKNVRVTGPRYGEDRRRFLEDCEVFICPSFSENFGNAIAEAMERGKPVITTTGTPWGVLAEEQLGWWVEPRVDHLRGAIAEALESSPERLHEMGLRGRQYVEKHLSWAGVVGRTLAVYQWLLGGPRPDCIDTQADVTETAVST